ncbi:hypothetical protein [Columbia Basin potato purple top phytoplasma]|nr:hypothetical protein [Columbia Basin potato purple top phytoplasma]
MFIDNKVLGIPLISSSYKNKSMSSIKQRKSVREIRQKFIHIIDNHDNLEQPEEKIFKSYYQGIQNIELMNSLKKNLYKCNKKINFFKNELEDKYSKQKNFNRILLYLYNEKKFFENVIKQKQDEIDIKIKNFLLKRFFTFKNEEINSLKENVANFQMQKSEIIQKISDFKQKKESIIKVIQNLKINILLLRNQKYKILEFFKIIKKNKKKQLMNFIDIFIQQMNLKYEIYPS